MGKAILVASLFGMAALNAIFPIVGIIAGSYSWADSISAGAAVFAASVGCMILIRD